MKIGILSDTHGHLNPQIHALFHDVDAIIHAGDIGNDNIFIELQTIAPLTAVRGNMDKTGRPALLHEYVVTTFDGVSLFIVHDLGGFPAVIKKHLHADIMRYQPQVVIFGHTHKPYSRYIGDVLYFNPGSATSGRSDAHQTLGRIDIHHGRVEATILPLSA